MSGATAFPPPDAAVYSGRAGVAAWLSAKRTIEVVAVRQPFIEALGHHTLSDYAEEFWLPVIGPSALWVQRRLAAGFLGGKTAYQLDIANLASEIGLGAGTGRHSPIIRTLLRLIDFDLALIVDPNRLGVRPFLPPLTRRQAARLPQHLAVRHRQQACVDRRLPTVTPVLEKDVRTATHHGAEVGR